MNLYLKPLFGYVKFYISRTQINIIPNGMIDLEKTRILTMKGMNGQSLVFDLSTESSETQPISDELIQNYLGGRGLAGKLFVDDMEDKIRLDPLSEENELVFATGT